jgi:hypothetical protein
MKGKPMDDRPMTTKRLLIKFDGSVSPEKAVEFLKVLREEVVRMGGSLQIDPADIPPGLPPALAAEIAALCDDDKSPADGD